MTERMGPATALVIVPFSTIDEANQWTDKVRMDYPDEAPLIVTPGRESMVIDPNTGETRHEVCFAGGWRAKSADSKEGMVVITRSDAEVASLSRERSGDGRSRG